MSVGRLKVTADADHLPVNLVDVREHLREDVATVGELTPYVKAASDHLEDVLGRSFLTKTYQWSLDAFGGRGRDPLDDYWFENVPRGPSMSLGMELPRAPLVGITSIQYTDTAGAVQTWADSNYQVDTSRDPGRVMPVSGQPWPTHGSPANYFNPVVITFTAGYGADHTSVPMLLKNAIYSMTAHLYEHRELVVMMPLSKINPGMWSRLSSYRLSNFA